MRRCAPCLCALVSLSVILGALPVEAQDLARAELLVQQGNLVQAQRIVEEALRKDPKNGRAVLLRSSILCMEGELERCKRELDRALALDPSLRQGWLNRSAIAIAERRYGDALKDLERAESLDPNAADNALNQGAVLLLDGKLELAAARFRRYLAQLPRSSEAQFLVAKNYANGGYESLCLEHLEQAIALDERIRARARADAAFAPLAHLPRMQALLENDRYLPPTGAFRRERTFRAPWKGTESELLIATLNAVQRLRWPLEPQVEVASTWALLWADLRIKLVARGGSETAIELIGLPERFSNEELFAQRAAELFSAVELELLRLGRASPFTRP